MKPLYPLSVLCAAMLSSCGMLEGLTTPGEYMPIYLQEASPLDPPGMEAVRAEARAKYVKEGLYADGETLEIQQGKAYLFTRNPEYYEGTTGRMVESAHAKIISCEGLYYFVEVEEGSKGFLRETDFVNPVKLVSTTAESDLLPIGVTPADSWGTQTGQDGNQTIMTNDSGRAVLVVSKKSRKSDEFNARRKELEKKGADNQEDTSLPTPADELPEPSGSFED